MKIIKEKVLYIDLDGVIVDYNSGFRLYSDKRSLGFFECMLPIEGAIDAVNKLAQKFEVYFLSSAPWSNPYSWIEKRLWVEKHLGNIAFKRLILSHNKGLLKGHYLIDDRDNNGVTDFEDEHIHFGSKEFPDWESVLKYLMPDKLD